MTKFNVGDKVAMPGVPIVVEVLEIGTCEDGPGCPLGEETFRFNDPGGLGNDWMHTSEFEVHDPVAVATDRVLEFLEDGS